MCEVIWGEGAILRLGQGTQGEARKRSPRCSAPFPHLENRGHGLCPWFLVPQAADALRLCGSLTSLPRQPEASSLPFNIEPRTSLEFSRWILALKALSGSTYSKHLVSGRTAPDPQQSHGPGTKPSCSTGLSSQETAAMEGQRPLVTPEHLSPLPPVPDTFAIYLSLLFIVRRPGIPANSELDWPAGPETAVPAKPEAAPRLPSPQPP